MRMWLCDTRILCTKHLLGEHVEMHMFVGTLNKKKKVDGYIKNNLFQPREIYKRHNELAIEMIRRGMKHKSTMHPQDVDIFYLCNEYQCWEVDKESALKDLISRCPECKKRMEKLNE